MEPFYRLQFLNVGFESGKWTNMNRLYFLLFGALFFCFSCENNVDDVRRITFNPKSPDETISKFRLVYNEGSKARVELFANLAETYNKPEKITYIRDSLRVNFFSETGEVVSTLTAKSGEINMSKNEIMVKDSVQLYNHRKKQHHRWMSHRTQRAGIDFLFEDRCAIGW